MQRSPSPTPRTARLLLILIVVCPVYVALGVWVSSRFPKTSDQAAYFRAGIAMAHGHLRLGGWLLTPPDFWTSDIPLSALLSLTWRLLGRPEASPLLLMIQPSILWAALVGSTLWLWQRHGSRLEKPRVEIPGGLLVILTFLGVPLLAMTPAYFVTLSAIHVGTVIYVLWALHCAAIGRLGPCAILLFLGTVGDPLMIVAAGLPVMLWGILRDAPLFGVAAGASLAAEGALALNGATGGFQTEGMPLRFATFDALRHNLSVAIQDGLVVLGADPSGLRIAEALPELARLALAVLGLHMLWRVARKKEAALFPILLSLCCAFTMLAFIVSDRIEADGNAMASTRYLFPFWAAFTLLAAFGARQVRGIPALGAIALVLSLASDVRALPPRSTGIVSTADQELIASLARQAPADGVASWWNSTALEAASMGRLRLTPALRSASGLTPFQHISPPQAFPGRPFFVLLPSPAQTFERADVIRTFGLPDRQFTSGTTTVLIYEGTSSG